MATTTGAVALSARQVSKSFPVRGHPPVEAIDDLSFDVVDGEFFSVVGPSGAGKTTLLKIIAGLMHPTSGKILAQGREVVEPIDNFGIVFQNPVLLQWRNALDNVLLPIEMLGREKRDYRSRAAELLQLVGLEGFERRLPRELSGGMQQRVALCRAVIHEPAVLLMDEPFGALDEFTRQALNDYLLTLWGASRKTIVFVTHSVAEAVYLSDRVAVLTSRPSRLIDVVSVKLPRPRDPELRYSPEFAEIVRRVQHMLRPSI